MTDVQLRRMISQWCDDRLSEQAFERLCHELRTNDHALETFVAYMQLHAALRANNLADRDLAAMLEKVSRRLASTYPSVTKVLPSKDAEEKSSAASHPRSWDIKNIGFLGGAIAAMLLISLMVFRGGLSRDEGGQPSAVQTRVGPAVDDSSMSTATNPIAQVVSVSSDCVWMFDHSSLPRENAVDPAAVHSGSIIRVMDGEMTLEFVNGVQVNLIGKALYSAVSPMSGRLLYGKCCAKICPGAEGFQLDAPTATVIDLGTEFGVEVDQRGEADVVVYDGAVEIDSGSGNDYERLRTSLKVGEAVRIASGGTVSRLTSIYSDKFLSSNSRTCGASPASIDCERGR